MPVTAIADIPLPSMRERLKARNIVEAVALHEALEAMRRDGAEAAGRVLATYAPAYEMLVDQAEVERSPAPRAPQDRKPKSGQPRRTG